MFFGKPIFKTQVIQCFGHFLYRILSKSVENVLNGATFPLSPYGNLLLSLNQFSGNS